MDNLNKELVLGIDAFDNAKYEDAFSFLMPLAKKGDLKAQCYIATMYQCGFGVQVDGVESVMWFTKVADQEMAEENLSAIACNNLSTIYSTGLPGIAIDKSLAKRYQEKARKLGFQM